jgi:leucyl-tRNA---protein transferase
LEHLDIENCKFYKSHPFSCSYIKNNTEQRLFIKLDNSKKSKILFNNLMTNGFRRNLDHMYLPVCENCKSCISSRINTYDFKLSKSNKRILRKNIDTYYIKKNKEIDLDRYKLFIKYTNFRHSEGEMKSMSFKEFKLFVYSSPVETRVFDFFNVENTLIGTILLDVLNDGLSAVYSFYDPDLTNNSLGKLMILKAVREVKKLKLDYLYLGFWIKESQKMNYKLDFNNLELFKNGKWEKKELVIV